MQTRKKRWGDRRDAYWLREMDGLHAVMPHLMPRRADAEVYTNMQFDVTETLRYLAEKNEGAEVRATLFHCMIMAIAKTLYLRPNLNRYISGRRFYQRYNITMGFVAKKRFADHSEEALILTDAKEDWTLTAVTDRIAGEVHKARSQENYGVDGVLNALNKVPRCLMMLILALFRLLDFYGRAPRIITDGDPDYTSVFLTNLGSIKAPAIYHHLNNHGTNSIMISIGTIHKAELVNDTGEKQIRDVVDLGITIDERIADGFYFARSLKIIQHLLSNPHLLDRPLKEDIDFVC